MNPVASTIDEYLDNLDHSVAPTAREIVTLYRKLLPAATERVQWGIAIFALDGKDVGGIAARKGFYSLYVPNAQISAKYLARLGNVDAGKGCVRFKKPEDLDRRVLSEMIRELARGAIE